MRIEPATRIRGSVITPGDKSISHRALLLAAMADGVSEISGISVGDDVGRTKEIIQQLGAVVTGGDTLRVKGAATGLAATTQVLNCGNSGTTIRLLMGVLAGVPGVHRLDGDESLRGRPMDRVANPLSQMGVTTRGVGDEIRAPLNVETPIHLRAVDYTVPVPSAQVKSAVLLAALYGDGPSTVREGVRTRSNTEDMLLAAGVEIATSDDGDGRIVKVSPSRPQPHRWVVPQDPSQAAFFIVAALLHPNAEVSARNVYAGRERLGFLNVLLRMGANLSMIQSSDTVDIRAMSSQLRGTTIASSEIPSVDEVPILVVAAAGATGDTTFTDMAELRIKESDRFQGSIDLARSLGAAVEVDGDSFTVTGVGASSLFQHLSGGHPGDHRMTMATAVAGWCGRGADIEHPESVFSSFPEFFQLLSSLTE